MAQTAQVNINVNATAANKSVQDLSNTINQAGGSAASLRAELRQVTMELQGLEPGGARFTELSQRAGQLRDRIADTSAVISATAGNVTENFGRALGNTIQLGVAGFQALSSAQVLFGTENEELNKSLAKMGALLNLSQAIETFGGLGDKLTEIKAGFTPLLTQLGLLKTTQTEVAVATGVADAAIVGEGVAAGGASVATAAFGAALNALPLVAIVTALGLLVAGLISYASSSGEASKAEERRVKTLKAQREEEEKSRQTIAKESAEYVNLIYQLKATNAGSEERKKLIKDINATYGTTLKNLSDETAFQKQLNLEVVNYIAYQKAKFQLQKNEALVQKNLEKQFDLNKKIAETTRQRDDAQKKLNATVASTQDYLYYQRDKDAIDALTKTINGYQSELGAAEKRLESYGKVSLDVSSTINELTSNGKKYGDQIDKNNKSLKDGTDTLKDYDSILSKIQQTEEENTKSREELFRKEAEYFDKTIDLVEVDQRVREEAAIQNYNNVKTAIDKELTAEKIKAEEKKKLLNLQKLNEENLTKFLQIENQRRLLDIKIQTFEILKENEKRIQLLKLEEEALQNEIRFGDGNTTDTKIALGIKREEALIKELDTRLMRSKYANQIELDEFEKIQQRKSEIQIYNLKKGFEDTENIATADFKRQIQLEKDAIEAKKDLNVTYTFDEFGQFADARVEIADKEVKDIIELQKQGKDAEIQAKSDALLAKTKLIDDALSKEKDQTKKTQLEIEKNEADAALAIYNQKVQQAKGLSDIQIKEQENLNDKIFNLEEEKNTKIYDATVQLEQDIKAVTIKTEDEILDEKIKRLDEYLGYAQQAFQQASSLISQFAKQQQEIRTTQLEDAIAFDKERIESQYAEGLISREQYDNAIEQLNQRQQQDQLQIDRKNFRTEKALSIAGATIDGARAVLGAFAGTPGGIIVRTIAAALAGVFAATQIALIARQEFKAADGGIVPGDGSGEIDSVPARLAPGEAVINSESTQAFLPLLSAINEMGGGRSFVPDLPATNAPQTFAPVFADNQRREPIRAYVVETDITDAQKRVARIERSTRF
jgi:hypothetical protein